MNNQRSFFFNVDWFTVVLYLILCIIGWFNIHSAIFDEEHPSIIDLSTNYGKQFIYILSALILATTI
ncbi:MAG: rod shape-determining protein RodA, partial [Sphingobacteriaceae bacterium]